MAGCGHALLGMQDIETLMSLLTINYETKGRQLISNNNPDKRQRNC